MKVALRDTAVLIRAGFVNPPAPTSAGDCLQLITFLLGKPLYKSSNPSHH